MHPAKGLEFRAGAIMACDDEVLPLQDRIETGAENADAEVSPSGACCKSLVPVREITCL